MKVLVLGSGGREHALVWKLRHSPSVEKVFCAPGSDGIAEDGTVLPDAKNISDPAAMVALAGQLGVDLTVDRKSTRLNSSHIQKSRMPSSA